MLEILPPPSTQDPKKAGLTINAFNETPEGQILRDKFATLLEQDSDNWNPDSNVDSIDLDSMTPEEILKS